MYTYSQLSGKTLEELQIICDYLKVEYNEEDGEVDLIDFILEDQYKE